VQVIKKLAVSSPTNSKIVKSPARAQYVSKCGSTPKKKCEIETHDVDKKEGNTPKCTTTPFVFTITVKNGPSDEEVTVNYTTEPGTATEGVDYQDNTGTATFSPGETVKTVTVLVNCDKTKEKDETFLFRLTAVTTNNSKIVGKNPVIGTIKNDD
jgi:hypothetical protein